MSKKKFNFVRAGAITMVLALGTSCFMSGTLAKYVTSKSGSDSARVAKFGVAVTANGTAFAETYKTDDKINVIANSEFSVISAEKVIAPGTKGDMASMTLTGTPEVAVKVTYAAEEFNLSGWTTNGTDYYCPLVITVGGTKLDGADYASEEAFETAVKNAVAGYSKVYAAGTDLAADKVKAESLAISWAWPFSTSADNDRKDTALGDRAAADTTANAENTGKITLKVTTTVTQID